MGLYIEDLECLGNEEVLMDPEELIFNVYDFCHWFFLTQVINVCKDYGVF